MEDLILAAIAFGAGAAATVPIFLLRGRSERPEPRVVEPPAPEVDRGFSSKEPAAEGGDIEDSPAAVERPPPEPDDGLSGAERYRRMKQGL